MTVGMMPLEDTDWERGRCSYKMLLYMARGVPVMVSPVGMNAEVLSQGDVGWGATTPAAGGEGPTSAVREPDEARRRGREGRSVVERHYALSTVAPRLADILQRTAGSAAPAGEGEA